jgi:hypothetical protein
MQLFKQTLMHIRMIFIFSAEFERLRAIYTKEAVPLEATEVVHLETH